MISYVSKVKESRFILLRKAERVNSNKTKRVVELSFRKAVIDFPLYGRNSIQFMGYILDNYIDSGLEDIDKDIETALYVDFIVRHKELSIGSEKFAQRLAVDPWFNALRIKYGYAITAKIANKSKWNNVCQA